MLYVDQHRVATGSVSRSCAGVRAPELSQSRGWYSRSFSTTISSADTGMTWHTRWNVMPQMASFATLTTATIACSIGTIPYWMIGNTTYLTT